MELTEHNDEKKQKFFGFTDEKPQGILRRLPPLARITLWAVHKIVVVRETLKFYTVTWTAIFPV